jgi:cell wall-associated NlpC family hydrolase
MTRRGLRAAAVRVLVPLVSCLACGTILLTTPASADPATDLDQARAEAAELRERLDQLDARLDQAAEELAHTRNLLAEAATRSTLAEEQLSAFAALRSSREDAAANRVREVYRLGGAVGVYGSILRASTPAELATRMVAVESVLALDQAEVADASQGQIAAAQAHQRLDAWAAERTRLVTRARTLATELVALRIELRRAVNEADARVRALAAELAEEQAAAAEAAANSQLADLGLLTVDRPAGTPSGSTAVATALTVLGAPYVWGDAGPDTFDCSGLMQWSYARAGLLLPRVSRDQYAGTAPVALTDVRPGDLLFYAYDVDDPSTIHHVTMYVGAGQMVHAPRTGDVVKVVPVTFDGFLGATRPRV